MYRWHRTWCGSGTTMDLGMLPWTTEIILYWLHISIVESHIPPSSCNNQGRVYGLYTMGGHPSHHPMGSTFTIYYSKQVCYMGCTGRLDDKFHPADLVVFGPPCRLSGSPKGNPACVEGGNCCLDLWNKPGSFQEKSILRSVELVILTILP